MCVGVIDTGSNIIAGPPDAITALTERVNINPTCTNLESAPVLKVKVGNVMLTIPPKSYVMEMEMPTSPFASARQAVDPGGAVPPQGSSPKPSTIDAPRSQLEELEAIGGLSLGLGEPGLRSEKEGMETAKRMSRAVVWRKLFDDLHKEKGIDLRKHIAGLSDSKLGVRETLCVPAFSELDANTQHGKLWILGTPVFSKYYTRFQWHSDRGPSISFLDKTKAQACKEKEKAEESKETSEHSDLKTVTNTSLLEEEQVQHPKNHRRMKMHELRFPHWAKGLVRV
jgi:hypothetical protein